MVHLVDVKMSAAMLLDPIVKPLTRVPPVADVAQALPRHWSESVKFDEVETFKPLQIGTFTNGQPIRVIPSLALSETMAKRLRGPESLYREEFCEEIIDLMSQGYTFAACAGFLGVSYETLLNWRDRHPALARVWARGKVARAYRWESCALDVVRTGGTGGQVTMIIRGLQSLGLDEWRDKQEIKHSGAISLASLVESSLKNITPRQPIEIEGESVPMLEAHSRNEA